LDQALLRHFGSKCEFEDSLQTWVGDEQVLTKVSKTAEDESYEQQFSVQHPTERSTFEANLSGHVRV
jgi:hypothetical protein